MRRLSLLCVIIVTSCAPLPPVPFLEELDVSAPVITAIGFESAHVLRIDFSEHATLVGDPIASSGVSVEGVTEDASSLRFTFDAAPSPASEHSLEAQVSDAIGNELRFVAHFYGLNEMLPALIINEFTTQGSSTHPDFVELRALTDGNLAGACVYEGIPENWEQRYIFPSVDVSAGDYIVVHFKPEGLAEERDEIASPDTSGGRDAYEEAWDFWVVGGSGLSGNNGVVSLCENPLGGYLDAVLYSNRTSDSDEAYRGFGSVAVLERADAIAAEHAWSFAGPQIAPEDAIDPEDSTSTRSICRASDGHDTNQSIDWHITPTRGLTPGSVNGDDVYVP